MAQKISIVLEDDLDGSVATQTIKFGLGGAAYEIDLSDENAERLRAALAPFNGAARKAGRSAATTRKTASAPGSPAATRKTAGAPVSPAATRKTAGAPGSPADIRAWAGLNGFSVPARGRIPADVRSAYDAAH